MKNILVIVFLLICIVFLVSAFVVRQEVIVIKNNTLVLKQQIDKIKSDLKTLEFLPKYKLGSLEENYQSLDVQVHLFTQYRNLKTFLNAEGLGQDGSITLAAKSSVWLGVDQMLADLKFYDLKEVEQFTVIYEFLKKISSKAPLEILEVNQNNDQVEIKFQLYGRCV